jgi:ATP-dependent RNA helicase RhlE
MAPQVETLRRGVDIVVATPGRLLDHMGRGTVEFSGLQILILDEADRMLDMGFLPDVRRILKALPAVRQTLLFSATMPPEIERLAHQTLRSPTVITVGQRSRPVETVRQAAFTVSQEQKKHFLCHLLAQRDLKHVLVFTRTKSRADRLARHLVRTGRRIAAIHGDKTQGARIKALERFKSGQIDVLVATDIAARGIDVDGISHVINFDVPNVPEDYVHRIGRTARAEATGDAISLVAPEESQYIRDIERLTGVAIARESTQGFEPVPEAFERREYTAHHGQGGRHGHADRRGNVARHGRPAHRGGPARSGDVIPAHSGHRSAAHAHSHAQAASSSHASSESRPHSQHRAWRAAAGPRRRFRGRGAAR